MSDGKGYYQDQASAALTTSFVSYNFGLIAGFLKIENDETSGSNTLVWSFDGVTTDGTLPPGKHIEVQDARVGAIYLKYTTGAPAYRLIAIQY